MTAKGLQETSPTTASQLSYTTIAKFDRYITYSHLAGFRLTRIPRGVRESEINIVLRQLEQSNTFIAALQSLQKTHTTAFSLSLAPDGHVAFTTTEGRQIITYWWGFDLLLSDAETKQLIYALNQTSQATAIAAIILSLFPVLGNVPSAIGAIGSLLISTGANALAFANQGHGVRIRIIFGVPARVYAR